MKNVPAIFFILVLSFKSNTQTRYASQYLELDSSSAVITRIDGKEKNRYMVEQDDQRDFLWTELLGRVRIPKSGGERLREGYK